MKATLKSINTDHYPSIQKTVCFIARENEVLICTEDGKEIASLDICVMDKEIRDDKDGKWKVVPSKNFWLQFNPKSSQTHPSCADVFSEE